MKTLAVILDPCGSEKPPAAARPEIEHRFCSTASFSETGLPSAPPALVPNRPFRNQARDGVEAPSLPANHGLCSSRATGVWWPDHFATTPSACAICKPADQPDFSVRISTVQTLAGSHQNNVFTCTQLTNVKSCFWTCSNGGVGAMVVPVLNEGWVL